MTIVEQRTPTTTLWQPPTPVDLRPMLTSERRSPVELLRLAQDRAEEALAWHESLAQPLAERAYELVEWNDDHEIWVIHWPVGGHLELHDHGGSCGAFWVVAGTLQETSVNGRGSLQHHDLTAGGGAAFGPRYVHDVRNDAGSIATSVHAYSPPLAAMNFYEHSGSTLTRTRSEDRSDPTWAP